MKTNRFFMLFAVAFIFLMAFSLEVSAQSKNEKVQYIVNTIKDELGVADGLNVRSVIVAGNTVVVDVVSTDVPAELFCDIVHAVKSYVNANDVQLRPKGKEFVDAFNAAGCKDILLKAYDAGSSKSGNVNLTARQFAAFSCMDEIDDDSQLMIDIMSYLPVETFVKIMAAGVKEEEGTVVLENKVIFFIMNMPPDELDEIWQVEEEYPGAMKEMMSRQVAENQDPSVGMLIEIAKKHGCKFGFKFASPGHKALEVILE